MRVSRRNDAVGQHTVPTLAQSFQLFSVNRRTLSIPRAWPHRIPILARDVEDINTHTGGDRGAEHKVMSLEACANELGGSFRRNDPTVDHPQSDRSAGRCGALARPFDFHPNCVAGHIIDRRILSMLGTASQVACITVQLGYETCHHGSTPLSSTAIEACSHIESSLLPSLRLLTRTSTPWFVVAALTHGALATHQYHMNRSDRYQDLCLGVGVLIGLVAGILSLADPAGRLAIVSTLTMAMTLALATSALGHFVVGMVYRRENAHVCAPDTKWVDEKRAIAGVV